MKHIRFRPVFERIPHNEYNEPPLLKGRRRAFNNRERVEFINDKIVSKHNAPHFKRPMVFSSDDVMKALSSTQDSKTTSLNRPTLYNNLKKIYNMFRFLTILKKVFEKLLRKLSKTEHTYYKYYNTTLLFL